MTPEEQAWTIAVKNIGLAKMFLKTRMSGLKVGVMNYDDYFQAAMLGLYFAALKYDETKSKFSVYAYKWMHQSISRTFRNEGFNSVRVPSFMFDKVSKVNKKRSRDIDSYLKLEANDTMRAAFSALAESFSITDENVLKIDSTAHLDRIDHEEKMCAFRECFDRLDGREKIVIQHLYGMNGFKQKKIKTIANMIRVSTRTAMRIRFSAFNKIKKHMGHL